MENTADSIDHELTIKLSYLSCDNTEIKLLDADEKKIDEFFYNAKDLFKFIVSDKKIYKECINKLFKNKIMNTYYSALKLCGLNEDYDLTQGFYKMFYNSLDYCFILSGIGIYSTINYNILLSLYYYKYGSLLLNNYDLTKTLYTSVAIQSFSLLYFNYSCMNYYLFGYALYYGGKIARKNGVEFIIE